MAELETVAPEDFFEAVFVFDEAVVFLVVAVVFLEEDTEVLADEDFALLFVCDSAAGTIRKIQNRYANSRFIYRLHVHQLSKYILCTHLFIFVCHGCLGIPIGIGSNLLHVNLHGKSRSILHLTTLEG